MQQRLIKVSDQHLCGFPLLWVIFHGFVAFPYLHRHLAHTQKMSLTGIIFWNPLFYFGCDPVIVFLTLSESTGSEQDDLFVMHFF